MPSTAARFIKANPTDTTQELGVQAWLVRPALLLLDLVRGGCRVRTRRALRVPRPEERY